MAYLLGNSAIGTKPASLNHVTPVMRNALSTGSIGLLTIGLLRNKYKVSLFPDLRQISEELKKTPDSDWSKLVFHRDPAGRIYLQHPKKGIVATSPLGQQPLFEIESVIRNVERNLARMNRRKPKQIGKVDQHRYVVRNEPTIAGTRIPTAAIYRLHQAGYNTEAIIREFPRLKPAHVEAAIQHERLKVAISVFGVHSR